MYLTDVPWLTSRCWGKLFTRIVSILLRLFAYQNLGDAVQREHLQIWGLIEEVGKMCKCFPAENWSYLVNDEIGPGLLLITNRKCRTLFQMR